MVAFLVAQKKANPELLNYHKVIRGQSYQKLRFDIDAPIKFIENVMADIKKPELKAEPTKPEATGLDFIDSLEFGLYEEKLAQVRRYNDYVTKTSLNEMRCVQLMNHIKVAIGVAFSKLYFSKGDILGLPANVEENLLVFDSSDHTEFSRHIIIPGVHVENHMEAKAFADEMVKYLDEKLRPVVDLGVYKSLQNFRLFNNKKVGSPRVKVYKLGTFEAFNDLLISYITEGSLKLPSILGQPTANAPKIETELTEEKSRPLSSWSMSWPQAIALRKSWETCLSSPGKKQVTALFANVTMSMITPTLLLSTIKLFGFTAGTQRPTAARRLPSYLATLM